MPKATVIVLGSILIYIVLFGSIACLLLPLGKFQSLEVKSEISVLPISYTDPAQYYEYRPTLYFRARDGQFDLQQSDYFFTGPYVCRFGIVVASYLSFDGPARSIGYTPVLGVMFWDRALYLNTLQIPISLIFLLIGIWIRDRERARRGSL